MNTSKPDALMQGIALQHYQELIPETRAVYISNAAKMEAYKKAYARVLQQLNEATRIHLQQQPTPTWITLTQTGVRLQALTTLNYSMLATQMRMNQEEAMKNSTPKITGRQMIQMRVPVYPARGVQQTTVSQYYAPTLRTPTLVRTESRPLATALELMETERQKHTEDKQAETPEPEIPKAPVSTPDTEEEKDEEKAKDKKEDQDQASTPNQETQGRNNVVEVVEHATPKESTEQREKRINFNLTAELQKEQVRNQPDLTKPRGVPLDSESLGAIPKTRSVLETRCLVDRECVKREATAQDVRRGSAAVGVAGTLLADGVLRHFLDDKARAGATALVTA